eukprot:SAG31_NODE_1429_length_8390_cov_2.259076_7_plen_146_part_00
MANCVYPCDFVGYLLSAKPVLLQGARCAEMGFTFATTDNIYVRLPYCTDGSCPLIISDANVTDSGQAVLEKHEPRTKHWWLLQPVLCQPYYGGGRKSKGTYFRLRSSYDIPVTPSVHALQAFAFLNATRDATPACKLGSSSRGSK